MLLYAEIQLLQVFMTKESVCTLEWLENWLNFPLNCVSQKEQF